MKRYVTSIIALSLLSFAPFMLNADEPLGEDDEEEEIVEEEEVTDGDPDDPEEESVRLNPVFDINVYDEDIDIPVPSFIHRNANHIIFNGADWTALRRAFAAAESRPVSIVHIGDSHVQADINTGTTRELLQYDFGNAGRGLVTPLKLAGTNEPRDYVFTSPDSWTSVKLMGRQWDRPMGFTGVSIHPNRNESSFTVGTVETDDYNPFSTLRIFHGGKMTIDRVVNQNNQAVNFRAIPSRDYTQIVMASQETRVTVYFTSQGDLTVNGVELGGNRPGLYYHAIGNNGAAYSTYNRIGNVGAGISALTPNLVIISLGTNEAFGRLDPTSFYQSIDRLVKNIKVANPDAQILLVTPMECQKSVSRKVTKRVRNTGRRSRRGRRGRRNSGGTRTVTQTVRDYVPNEKIEQVRNEILRYGRENNVAVLDFYEIAGGRGASKTWASNSLFANDKIHHTAKGYHLQGRLLYEALIDALQTTN